jgi:hypothetical protein
MEHVPDVNPNVYRVMRLNAFNVLPITPFKMPLLHASFKPFFLPNFMDVCWLRNQAHFISAIFVIRLKTWWSGLNSKAANAWLGITGMPHPSNAKIFAAMAWFTVHSAMTPTRSAMTAAVPTAKFKLGFIVKLSQLDQNVTANKSSSMQLRMFSKMSPNTTKAPLFSSQWFGKCPFYSLKVN